MGPTPPPPPFIFRPNWGPKGEKKFLGETVPFLRVWMTPPPHFQGQTIKFHDFPGLENEMLKFHDFPGLENEMLKFPDFPAFLWPVWTL